MTKKHQVLVTRLEQEDAIGALPTKKLTSCDLNADERCGVCWEEREPDNTVTVLSCGHWFDQDCLAEWFTISENCPKCRRAVELGFDGKLPRPVIILLQVFDCADASPASCSTGTGRMPKGVPAQGVH